MLCLGTLLKNPDLEIDKNYLKCKQTVFLLMAPLFMNLIYSNKEIVYLQIHTKINVFFINCPFDTMSFRANVVFRQMSFRLSVVSIRCRLMSFRSTVDRSTVAAPSGQCSMECNRMFLTGKCVTLSFINFQFKLKKGNITHLSVKNI